MLFELGTLDSLQGFDTIDTKRLTCSYKPQNPITNDNHSLGFISIYFRFKDPKNEVALSSSLGFWAFIKYHLIQGIL